MISLKFVLTALMAASAALGHAEPSTPFANHHKELARRQLEMNKRHVLARNCAPQVAEYQRLRKARRALRKRGLPTGPIQLKPNQSQNQGHGQNPGDQNHGQNHGGPGQHNGPSGAPSGSVPATTPAVSTPVDSTDASTSDVTVTAIDETTEVVTSVSSSDESASTVVETVTDDPTSTDVTSIYSTTTGTAAAAHYSTIQNTCVMAPEVVEGPYYLRDDYVRQDIREDQPGTPLYLDIGVLDITTCTPLNDVFVELWSANAQGEYSGFGSAATGAGGGGNGTAPTGSGGPPTGAAPTQSGNNTAIPTGTFSGSMPSGSGAPGGGGGGSSGKANGDNFLRGGYTVDDNGIVEIATIYPGFYSGRTVHIHTMVHQNLSYHSNGTIVSSSGSVRHIGQFFFDEALNTEVLAQEAYSNTGQSHTYNEQDGILQTANTGGYSAFIEIEKLGDTLDEGLLGYITVGIDTSASYTIATSNYWDPDFEPVSSASST